MLYIIAVLFILEFSFLTSMANSNTGKIYTIPVKQSVTLESPHRYLQNLPYLIVAKHPHYPKKRSLVQFHDFEIKSNNTIIWAKMYIYFAYAHKPSWLTIHEAPYLSRTLQIHQVNKAWILGEANSMYRKTDVEWTKDYLSLDGSDAAAYTQDTVTLFTYRPKGFVEIDITEAVRNWNSGQPNNGLLIWATNEDENGRDMRFYGKQYSDSTTHPYVNVLCSY